MRLNLGCGRDIRDGWINLDVRPGPGVDVIADLVQDPLPFPADSVDEIYGSHIIEHLAEPLPFMEQLWRVAKPDAVATFRTPYGSSDDADDDPTHVRRLFPNSWLYYGQPNYWRADYGYRGDWLVERIDLWIYPTYNDFPDDQVRLGIQMSRNVVKEMVATLRAVKPAREPRREAQEPLPIIIRRSSS